MVSGKEIAAILGVSPPTVSKWRQGRSPIPAAKLAFLTLLLAHGLAELEERAVGAGNEAPFANPTAAWRARLNAHIAATRRCLKLQEAVNSVLGQDAHIEGARMFRLWWNGTRGGPGRFGRTAGGEYRGKT